MTKLKFADALASIRGDLLVDFSGRACQIGFNPAAGWLGKIFAHELARRNGEPTKPIPPLTLDDQEMEFALEWLDFAVQCYASAASEIDDPSLATLAGVLRHLRNLLEKKMHPLQSE